MSSPESIEQFVKTVPGPKARLAGFAELMEGLTATGGQVIILGKLVVGDNAAATARNILENQHLFWFGFALSVLGIVFHIIWAFLFYRMFKPVNKSLSLLALYFILIGCAIQAVTCVFYAAPIYVLQGAGSFSTFDQNQLQTIALILFKVNGIAFDTYLIFFGIWCILTGYLISKSTFMPKLIGKLVIVSGIAWTVFLVPNFAHRVFPILAVASALGELPLQFWLIFKGVDVQAWKKQVFDSIQTSNF
jgi:hypothetical protein